MAEWLGRLMQNWPSWAIFLAVIGIMIAGMLYYFAYYAGESGSVPAWKRGKHGKN